MVTTSWMTYTLWYVSSGIVVCHIAYIRLQVVPHDTLFVIRTQLTSNHSFAGYPTNNMDELGALSSSVHKVTKQANEIPSRQISRHFHSMHKYFLKNST